MTMLSTPEVLRRISERGGLDPTATGRLTRTTLRAIAAQLQASQAAELADDLPPTLAEWVLSARFADPRGLAALMHEVAFDEPRAPSFTGEHVAVVCHVLAEALRPEALRKLRLALPEDVALLLEPRDARPRATVRQPLREKRLTPERERPTPATARPRRR